MISAMAQQDSNVLPKFIAVARYIAANADETLTLKQLAGRVHLSPSRFQRVFKSIFGVSPKKFQQAARSDRFKALLRDGTDITEAIYTAGYGSSSRVYENSMHNIGMTPKSYRAGGRGEVLSWACRDTSLGPILMAATDRGVCFAQFGSDCDRHSSWINGLTRSMPTFRINSRVPSCRWICRVLPFRSRSGSFC
jgi:AraC family transcriptional regulator of adaptative response/methylated-DNA-[protein]-cysteine methyltransferase